MDGARSFIPSCWIWAGGRCLPYRGCCLDVVLLRFRRSFCPYNWSVLAGLAPAIRRTVVSWRKTFKTENNRSTHDRWNAKNISNGHTSINQAWSDGQRSSHRRLLLQPSGIYSHLQILTWLATTKHLSIPGSFVQCLGEISPHALLLLPTLWNGRFQRGHNLLDTINSIEQYSQIQILLTHPRIRTIQTQLFKLRCHRNY